MRALWRDLQHLTDTYRGERPLADFLKSFFKKNHRLGSRDRKLITDASFAWYRAANGFGERSFEEKMKACIRLCGQEKKLSVLFENQEDFLPEKTFSDRLGSARNEGFEPEKLLPAEPAFSEGMAQREWLESMLRQPQLFVRLRPNANHKTLFGILQKAEIPFEGIGENTLSMPAATPLHTLWPQEAYAVQDWGSQQVCRFLNADKNQSWWDVCAGGGGKSLYLKDVFPDTRLLSTDIRSQALAALDSRFKASGIRPPHSRVVDAGNPQELAAKMGADRFDGIVCDVPCSGSGTWARTPEMLHFFKPESLHDLQVLQTKIALNSLQYLKSGGQFVYITCSVFDAENEAVVDRILAANSNLTLQKKALENGIPHHADSLFAAVFHKS